ncbi:MAG: hypothetical protein NVS3B20_17320 [Polyangiales bacterium]
MVAAGDSTCLRVDNTIRCWGDNFAGHLGDGTITNHRSPVKGPEVRDAALSTFALSFQHSCLLQADGTMKCAGSNRFGELGIGSFDGPTTPTKVKFPGQHDPVTIIGVGPEHTCAASATRLWCWGNNDHGELGRGSREDVTPNAPLEVCRELFTPESSTQSSIRCDDRSKGMAGVVQIAVGREQTCVVLKDGSAYCFGANGNGQLGTKSKLASFKPASVVGLRGIAEIRIGEQRACARKTDGTVACWGLVLGTEVNQTDAPVAVPGLTSVTQLAVGLKHACAVLKDGTVKCWGANARGELGLNSHTSQRTPTLVPGLTGVVEVALGDNHTCARLASRAVKCWGFNAVGQLGDGTTTESHAPVTVVKQF